MLSKSLCHHILYTNISKSSYNITSHRENALTQEESLHLARYLSQSIARLLVRRVVCIPLGYSATDLQSFPALHHGSPDTPRETGHPMTHLAASRCIHAASCL